MAIEVHVDQGPDFAGLRFWIFDRHPNNGRIYIFRFGKHNVTLEDLGEDANCMDVPEPTFQLPRDHATQFIKAMAELAVKRGIKTESDQKMEGRADAMESHLSDMRRLVFRDEDKQIQSLVAEVSSLRKDYDALKKQDGPN